MQVLHRGRSIVTDNTTREPTPEQRATYIWERIHATEPRPTLWDLACFCTETLALIAVEYDFLRPFVRRLVSIVYTAHNNTPDAFPSCLSSERKSNLIIRE